MAQYGRYDPTNTANTSTLFNYQEVPVTSTKVNRWDGNLAAAFELFHQVCSALLAKNNAAVITTSNNDSLQVVPADPPDMTVRIHPGWAMLVNSFAGILSIQPVPSSGVFLPPVANPRIDLIVLTGLGGWIVIEGSEAVSPTPPEPPEDSIELARIYHRVGATQIRSEDNGEQSYIVDVRPRLLLGEAHYHSLDRIPLQSPDGSRKQFSTLQVFRANSLEVYVNGVLQRMDADYSEDPDRRGYTFVDSPLQNYKIQHRYLIDYELD